MPYITQDRRNVFDPYIKVLAAALIESALTPSDGTRSDGDLNYVITRLITDVLRLSAAPNYHAFNTAIGILECVKQEMYRRQIGPYEDEKIILNGDLWK